MAAKLKLLAVALVLCLFVSVAFGLRTPQLDDAQQCRVQSFSPSQPFQSFQSEGGVIERWNENDPQFRCAGVAPLRIVIQPKNFLVPNYQPSPRLAYVVQGNGWLGITIPGCVQPFSSSSSQQEQYPQGQEDRHQKIRRIRRGDVIAVTAGAAHWWANRDDNEDLVIVTFNDLNHMANQLDQRLRLFFLGGGQQSLDQEGENPFKNMLGGFDPQFIAEAANVPVEIVNKVQGQGQGVQGGPIARFQHPAEEEEGEEEQEQQGGHEGQAANGIDETICAMKLHININHRKQSDVYIKEAGRLSIVDKHKLPILRSMDMSLEKGDLSANAFLTPEWTTTGHCILYVVNGDAEVQMANYHGQNVMNHRANQGDIVVLPQFFASIIKAGNNGFEFVAVKTSGTPVKNHFAGETSVIKGLPLEIVSRIFDISPGQAQQLKNSREGQTSLLSPSERSY